MGNGISKRGGQEVSPALDVLTRALVWWLALLALLPGLPGAWTGVVPAYEAFGWALIGLTILARFGLRWRSRGPVVGAESGGSETVRGIVIDDCPALHSRGWRSLATEAVRGVFEQARGVRPAVWVGAGFFAWMALRTWQTGAMGSRPLWMALALFLAAATLPRRSLRLFPAAFHIVGWWVLALAGLDLLGAIPSGVFRAWRDMPFVFGPQERLSATFSHPNLLAFFLLAQWLNGFVVLRMRRASGRSGWPVYLFSFLTILALSLTFSRAVLIGGIVILAVAGRRLAARNRPLAPARFDYLAAGIAALVFGFALTSQVWRGRVEQLNNMKDQARQSLMASAPAAAPSLTPGAGPTLAEDSESSVTAVAVAFPDLPRSTFAELEKMSRVDLWRDGVYLFRRSPFVGSGAGGYFLHGRGHLHSHNVLLEIAVSGGAAGLILLLGGLGLAFWRTRNFHWWHVLLALPFATGIFDCFLFFNFVLFLTAFAFGLAARGKGPVERLPQSSPRLALGGAFGRLVPKTERQARVVTVVAFVLFTVILGFTIGKPTPDFYAYYAATQYTNATGDIPYVVWPSKFEIPTDHPLAAFAMARHGFQPVRFFYPPTALVLFSPLARISQAATASTVWFGLEIGLVLLLAWGASRLAGFRGIHWLVLLAVLSHSPVSSSILFGQFSLPLAALAVWVWLLHRDGHSFGAGLLLSMGIAFKAYPLLWLGFLLIRPRGAWRLCLGCLVGCAALVGMSVAFYGVDFWFAFHRWVLGPLNTYSPYLSMSMRGLMGFLGFTPGDTPLNWGVLVGLGALYGVGGWKYRRDGGSVDVLAAGVVALSVLASPVAWYHYACLVTGFLAAFAGRIQRDGATPLALLSVGLLFVTGLEFTGRALPQATVRASLGFIVIVLLPWLLPMLEGPDRVSWCPFPLREDSIHEPAKTA